ncbi:translation initiation factor eIF-1A [Candidatus Woesearchaeota archaeon]|nr:translation initiation factor eIF-1A [Candidatus Woesearchaeota archaeon]
MASPQAKARKGKSDFKNRDSQEEIIERVRLPRGKETFGILDQRLGGSKMRVRCMDGKTRICRVPGRLKRKLWVREGDILLIEPWLLGGDDKGDVVYKYRSNQVAWLKKKGLLDELDTYEEF